MSAHYIQTGIALWITRSFKGPKGGKKKRKAKCTIYPDFWKIFQTLWAKEDYNIQVGGDPKCN